MIAGLVRADSLNHLGLLALDEANDYAAALRHYEDALEIVEGVYSDLWSRQTATTLMNIGGALTLQRNPQGARLRLLQALAIQHFLDGMTGRDLPYCMALIGDTYFLEDNHEQAALWHGRALGLHDRMYGPEHPNLAYRRANLFVTRSLLKLLHAEFPPEDGGREEFTQVMADYITALRPMEMQLGEGHPSVDTFHRSRDELAATWAEIPPPPSRRTRRLWHVFHTLSRANDVLIRHSRIALRGMQFILGIVWAQLLIAVVLIIRWDQAMMVVPLVPITAAMGALSFIVVRKQREFLRFCELATIARRGAGCPYELGQEVMAALDWAVCDRKCRDPYARFARAGVLWMLQRYKEAETDYTALIGKNPNDAVALRYRGGVYLDLGQFHQALEDLNRAIALDDHSAYARCLRGQALYKIGHTDAALADFTRATEVNQDTILGWHHRAAIEHDMGLYVEAVAGFDEALRVVPDAVFALSWRGAAKRALKRYQDALVDLDRALELDPGEQVALWERGEIYRMLGRHGDALRDFGRLLAIAPDHEHAWCGSGEAQRELGQYERAISDFNQALRLDPNDDFALSRRGAAKRMLGHYDDALADLDRSLEVNPSCAFAREERAKIENQTRFPSGGPHDRSRIPSRRTRQTTKSARDPVTLQAEDSLLGEEG